MEEKDVQSRSKKIKIKCLKVEGEIQYYEEGLLGAMSQNDFEEILKMIKVQFGNCEDDFFRHGFNKKKSIGKRLNSYNAHNSFLNHELIYNN